MTNRALVYLVKEQKPLVLPADATVRDACKAMWDRRTGSVLVADGDASLAGIFTGRDCAKLLARSAGKDASKGQSRDVGALPLARVMTREPVSISPDRRAIDALRDMQAGGFRHLPVTEDGKIRGIVSRADFKGMEFEAYRWSQRGDVPALTHRTLAEIVEGRKPLVMTVEQSVADACRAMIRRNMGSVLITDKRGRLKGIFTGRDALRALAKAKNAATTRLSKVMTPDPATMAPEAVAIDALRLMNDGGFRHLPVVSRGTILGIVSRTDFTGIEIDRLDEEEHLKECLW